MHALSKSLRPFVIPVICLATLATILVVLVSRNDSWIYTRPGWLDPWTYVGFGYEYANPLFLPGHYKMSRLPWVLAEFSVRQLFNVVAAQYVLQLGALFIEGAFFFLAIKRLLGSVSAVVSAAFLLTVTFAHGPAHSSGGADYHTALSGPLFACSFYFLTRAAESGSVITSFLFGAVIGMTVHTNPLYLNFGAALTIHCVSIWIEQRRTGWISLLLKLVAIATAGALSITLVLCIVNWLDGREFLFFLPQIAYTKFYLLDRTQTAHWWKSWENGWYWDSEYLALICAGFIVATVLPLVAAYFSMDRKVRIYIQSLSFQYLILALIWIAWQTFGRDALQPGYFAYPLWIPLAGVVACLIALHGDRIDAFNIFLVCGTSVIAFAFPYSFYGDLARVIAFLPTVPFEKVFVTFLIIFSAAIILARRRGGIYILALLLGIGNALSAEYPEFYSREGCTASRDGQVVITSIHKYLASLDPTFTRVLLWAARDEEESLTPCANMPTRFFADSTAFTGFRHLVSDRSGQVMLDPYTPITKIDGKILTDAIKADSIIVLVTRRAELPEQLRKRFAAMGKIYGTARNKSFTAGTITVPLFILK